MISATVGLLMAGGAVIGFLLAVLGAGGSILLLPLLVSGAGLGTKAALPLSLLVVIVLALANLAPYARRGQLAFKPALNLGLPAVVGSLLGAKWVRAGYVPEPLQLAVFAGAALVASWLLNQPLPAAHSPHPYQRLKSAPRQFQIQLVGQGVLVGLLTGIAGVGGGFAIVPALVLIGGLPMPLASGTSLLLIPLNALVALIALGHWPAAELPLMVPLVTGGLVGAIAGQRLAPHCPDRHLRRGFSALLIGSALLSGGEAWRRHQQPSGVSLHPSAPTAQHTQPQPHQLAHFHLEGLHLERLHPERLHPDPNKP